jgi:asparagine synthase (glutamine-hydrolysing)
MCGIAGLIRAHREHFSNTSASVARAMAATLVHRGPDDAGLWESSDGEVALVHRRLSIIDLSPLGRNPMDRDGGRLWITFNGEIYNYLELREELSALGHRFRSRTDTEVILAAYDQWGTDCVHRLAGMFAFALWDDARKRLWLTRDRLGKKPLYYSSRAGVLAFASELKALVADPSFPRDIDQAALGLYLRYGYIPAPLSIYTSARKLPPGHDAVFENGQLRVRQYWDPLAFVGRHSAASAPEAEETLERLLGTAVRQRQIADVPLGAFLSGGVDSSLIVALMQEQATTPVKTFTIRFENPEYNEADFAAAVARHLGTEHHEEMCGAQQMLDVVDRIPQMYDEPFADSSAIPTYLVSGIARKHVTVALSGDGGDELFFGYPRYAHHADNGWVLGLPRPVRRGAAIAAARLPTRRLRRIADVLRDDDADGYGRFVSWLPSDQVAALTGAAPAGAPLYAAMLARLENVPREERPALLDVVTYLPDDILAKVDRASMAVALEVRSPLLDHRVVEFALGLPTRLKRQGRTTKWLLRRLLDKRVPRHLIDRPKMGFGVPLENWFRGPLRDRMSEYCAGDDLEHLGLDPATVRRQWKRFLAGAAYRPDLLWQIYTLVAWAREFRDVPQLIRSGPDAR